MYVEGELGNVTGDPLLPLSSFFQLLQPPTHLYLGIDEGGVWIAVWFEPALGGAAMSLYIAPEKRRSLQAAGALQWLYDCGLTMFGTIYSITGQERLLPFMEALGYNVVGKLPGGFPGGTYIAIMTRESFDNRAFAQDLNTIPLKDA